MVDGVPIREADVARLARAAPTSPEGSPSRDALLLQLVERQLVAHAAAELYLTTSDEELERAMQNVAETAGMTVEQLQAAVRDTTAMSWEEYRGEVAAQIREMRLVMATGSWASTVGWGAPRASPESEAERMQLARSRVLGCLRARAQISVEDVTVDLPENPFATAATIAAVRIVGDPGPLVTELETAATVAAAGKPLCDSIAAAEAAMTQVYLERGYLDGRVRIPWPETPGTTTIEVQTVAGARHVIGEIGVDQRAVPKAKRVKDGELRRRIAAVGKTGGVASASTLQGIVEVVETAFRDAGVGPVRVTAERKPRGEGQDVRVDLAFRVGGEGG